MHTLVFQSMKNCCPFCGPIAGHHNQKLDSDQDLVARRSRVPAVVDRTITVLSVCFCNLHGFV